MISMVNSVHHMSWYVWYACWTAGSDAMLTRILMFSTVFIFVFLIWVIFLLFQQYRRGIWKFKILSEGYWFVDFKKLKWFLMLCLKTRGHCFYFWIQIAPWAVWLLPQLWWFRGKSRYLTMHRLIVLYEFVQIQWLLKCFAINCRHTSGVNIHFVNILIALPRSL